MSGKLYVVATPIGNAGDISERAVKALAEADLIAAEDTRTVKKLLGILRLRNKSVSNHRFNEYGRTEFLVSELLSGKDVALVSDAGTPCVSDPGGALVRAAAQNGIETVAVCGPSAVTAALSVSGFVFGSFAFYGYMPRGDAGIKKALEAARRAAVSPDSVSVFFESPRRVKKTLSAITEAAGDSELCLCNDMTKLFERVYRGTPCNVLTELNENDSAEKGEYTLVIKFGERGREEGEVCVISPEAVVADCMAKNGLTAKEAVAALSAKGARYTKKELYSASLNLKKLFNDIQVNEKNKRANDLV